MAEAFANIVKIVSGGSEVWRNLKRKKKKSPLCRAVHMHVKHLVRSNFTLRHAILNDDII
jgi:hypothetical protein